MKTELKIFVTAWLSIDMLVVVSFLFLPLLAILQQVCTVISSTIDSYHSLKQEKEKSKRFLPDWRASFVSFF
jgi:uncharacterized membrane protein YjgN (DUF898 family)